MPKRMRAVIYARYSTDLQSERSIDDQVALCREFAQKQGLTVREVYSDKAQTSASLIGRDGILRLVEDSRAGKFDVVIVEALDRISRDQEDLAGIHKRLTFANVDILAVHDGLADEIQIGIRGLVGSLYLKDLKKKVRRGMQGVIRDGRHAGGKAYGYEPIPGKPGEMRILDHEADVIRRIFKEYLAGRTAREIANGLNEDGVIAPRGGSWNASTINGNKERGHGILLNPLYTGDLVWNRVTMIRHPETGRRVSRVNPESEWMRKDVPDLAIIDRDTWDAAQARKTSRSKAHSHGRRDRTPKRPFSGLLRCGKCGGGMSIHDRSGSAIRIRCSTARESGSCDNDKRYRLDKIEHAVLEKLKAELADPIYVKEYLKAYYDERRTLIRETERNRSSIEKELTETQGRLARLVDLYTRGVIDGPAAEKDIAEATAKRKALEARLAEQEEPEVVELHPATLERYFATIDTLIWKLTDLNPQFDRELVETLHKIIARITVFPATDQGVTIEVTGWLQSLIGVVPGHVGGVMVAEEGLEPPTRGL
ncbi:MAG: recombinase family protein [Natronohydrobacter sp.]|nr:recombinase family protein [Natronohydrobacter sp.]